MDDAGSGRKQYLQPGRNKQKKLRLHPPQNTVDISLVLTNSQNTCPSFKDRSKPHTRQDEASCY